LAHDQAFWLARRSDLRVLGSRRANLRTRPGPSSGLVPHARTVKTGLGEDGVDDLAHLVRRFMAACQVVGRSWGACPSPTYRHRHDGAPGPHPAGPGAGRGGRLRWQRKTTLARSIAARLDARHIERDALGDDEAPGLAALVAAAVEAAGPRWVFDGAPYKAEALVCGTSQPGRTRCGRRPPGSACHCMAWGDPASQTTPALPGPGGRRDHHRPGLAALFKGRPSARRGPSVPTTAATLYPGTAA
jgi:hypothetical protein